MKRALHPYAHTLTRFSTASGRAARLFSLPALAASHPGIARMPHSLRIVLESVLRHCDGHKVTTQHVVQLASWRADAPRTEEVPFVVARVLLQDFTGVPLLADLAAMRNAAVRLGHDPGRVEPLVAGHLRQRAHPEPHAAPACRRVSSGRRLHPGGG